MSHLNVEIKADCPNPGNVRERLRSMNADHRGTDHQVDTYFSVPDGRLKLREGNIENHLIFYRRPDKKEPRPARIHLHETEQDTTLKPLLEAALEVVVRVRKKRDIYFIDNVKFHVDSVEELGTFVEIEAIDRDGNRSEEQLREQCETYMGELSIDTDRLVSRSYADLLMDEK